MTSMDRYMEDVDPGLADIIKEVAEISKIISTGFVRQQGSAGTENVYGEEQKKMDVWADELLIDALKKLRSVSSISSEERDDLVKANEDGEYSVTFDPLDGSSLIDVNLTVGTIMGIHKRKDPMGKGKDMVAAGYVLYGPLTVFTFTTGKGVNSFVLDKSGEYSLFEEDLKIGDGKLYAPGGLRKDYLKVNNDFVSELENKGYKLRYSGSFVADVHQILHKGGVFMYPALENKPEGKLRLLVECLPMGYVVSQAGGRISDGKEDILEKVPKKIDERTPVYIGGKREIEMIESMNGS